MASPLWTAAATAGLPAGEQGDARGHYFWGLVAGLPLAAFVVWDTWRHVRNPYRKEVPRQIVNSLLPVGYAASLWIERTVSGTLWGPFLLGVFGTVCLSLAVAGVIVPFVWQTPRQRP